MSTTTEILIWEELDENSESGRMVSAWSFKLNGEDFGGYCSNEPDARSDAEIVLKSKLADLTREQMGEAYRQLVGYDPTKEPDVGPNGWMSDDQLRELLFDRMGES